jgi:4,5-dihydroxyphthalate decarboxylase
MAKDRGLPLTAIPIFPRRLFSQSCMFVRADSEMTEPHHLLGKRVALSSFQTTLSLLAKGDLKFEYGVPWEEIHWFVTTEEKVAFKPKAGVRIDRLPPDADLGELLEAGKIDAFFMPHPPRSVMSGERKARRLFADTPAEELRYFQKHGAFPIMHVLVMHEDLPVQEPWLPEAIMEAYKDSLAISEDYFADPNWSRLAWGRHYFERERVMLKNAWPIGFAANRANLERFIMYSHDQALISSQYDPERLFIGSTLAS